MRYIYPPIIQQTLTHTATEVIVDQSRWRGELIGCDCLGHHTPRTAKVPYRNALSCVRLQRAQELQDRSRQDETYITLHFTSSASSSPDFDAVPPSLTPTQHAARSSVAVQPHVNLVPTLARGQNTSQLPNSSTQSSLARTHFSHLQRSLRHPRRKCPPSGLALHLPPHLPTWIRPRTRRPPRAAAATLTTPACTPSPPPRSTTRTPPTMRVRRPHTQTLASAAPTHSPPITPRTGNRVGMA